MKTLEPELELYVRPLLAGNNMILCAGLGTGACTTITATLSV